MVLLPRVSARSFRVPERLRIVIGWFIVTSYFTGAEAGNSTMSLNEAIQHRPAIHFSPRENFMNDPNGLMYDEEARKYHLYYQLNPNDTIAGNQHWGHATSPDLLHWSDEPIALKPTKGNGLAFSGSMVNDFNNTSGLFPGNGSQNFVAVYTQAFPDRQVQAIAYSLDAGQSFKEYAGNPVLNLNMSQFRDPQVQWYAPLSKWVMTVAVSREHKVQFYESKDLKHWNATGEFTGGILGVDYECPNLVPVRQEGTNETKWVLFLSINPGMPSGGSGTQYFIGDFDGFKFKQEHGMAVTDILDFGKDNYALQYFNRDHEQLRAQDIDNATYIGWFGNWQYCQEAPTGSWRGAMTVPRKISIAKDWLGNDKLKQEPRNIETLRLPSYKNASFNLSVARPGDRNESKSLNSSSWELPKSTAIEILVHGSFSNSSSSAAHPQRFSLEIFNNDGEKLSLGIDVSSSQMWIDRTQTTGFSNPFFTGKFSKALKQPTLEFNWRIILDGSLLEVYAEDGLSVASVVYYPKTPLQALRVALENAGSVSGNVSIFPLKATMSRETLYNTK